MKSSGKRCRFRFGKTRRGTRDLESFRVNRPWLQLQATRLPLQLGRERDRDAVSI
jgi:hypothetical protein